MSGFRPPVILVVDDNELNRGVLARKLERAGLTVELAEDGEEAVTKIMASPPDLVLLDWMMPRMSGIEVLQSVRKKHSLLELPVIMVTARTGGDAVAEALQAGANDFVGKPINTQVALAKIRVALQLRAEVVRSDMQLPAEFLLRSSGDGSAA